MSNVAFQFFRDDYFGPYGWDDKKGVAVEAQEWQRRVTLAGAAKKLAQEIRSNAGRAKPLEVKTRPEDQEDEVIPNIVIPTSSTQTSAGNRPIIIEEIGDEMDVASKEMLPLAFEQSISLTKLKIVITLPEIVSFVLNIRFVVMILIIRFMASIDSYLS